MSAPTWSEVSERHTMTNPIAKKPKPRFLGFGFTFTVLSVRGLAGPVVIDRKHE